MQSAKEKVPRPILVSILSLLAGVIIGGSVVLRIDADSAYAEKRYVETMRASQEITEMVDALKLNDGKTSELQTYLKELIQSADSVLEEHHPEMTARELYYYDQMKPVVSSALRRGQP